MSEKPLNITLNPGGWIGAVCGAAIGTLVFLSLSTRVTMLIVGGLAIGALIGNYLWILAFRRA
jgi:hypothetical protein